MVTDYSKYMLKHEWEEKYSFNRKNDAYDG